VNVVGQLPQTLFAFFARCLGPLEGCDVARDRRRTDDLPVRILDGRDGQRDVDLFAVFAHALRFDVRDRFAAPDLFHDVAEFFIRSRREQHGD